MYYLNLCVGRKGLGYNVVYLSSLPAAEADRLHLRGCEAIGLDWRNFHDCSYLLTYEEAEALRRVPALAGSIEPSDFPEGPFKWDLGDDITHEDVWAEIVRFQAVSEGVNLYLALLQTDPIDIGGEYFGCVQ